MIDMGQHLTTGMLIRYTLPSMATLVFASIYGIVDGFFVSNFAGKTAFAAVNIILPFVNILTAAGIMVGTGGTAIVSKLRGEGDDDKANRAFSLVVYFAAILGTVLAILGTIFIPSVARALGAEGEMLQICILYGRLCMISAPAFVLQLAFQPFFPAAGKPKLGLWITVASGCANMILDALFIGVFGWGVTGAAVATNVSEYIGGLLPVFYFARKNPSFLKLGRTKLSWGTIGHTCLNGSSELVGEIAFSIVAMAYNWQLLRFLGADGVAAYGIIMYTGFIFGAVMFGFTMGASPLMSYQYGAQNRQEMRSLFRNCMKFMLVAGLLMFAAGELCARPLSFIFASYDAGLLNLSVHAYRIYSISFLLMGIPIYGSSLFTALGNGPVSAAISFLRSLVFETGAVILLPLLFGADAIWFAVIVAEFAASIVAFAFILKFNGRYGYLPPRAGK